MAALDSSSEAGGPTPAPQLVNQILDPLSGIFRSIWDVSAVTPPTNPPTDTATASHASSAPHKGTAPAAPPPSQSSVPNAYPSGLGHPANADLGGPLRLVPYNLAITNHYPNSFTINPYKSVDRLPMGSFWAQCYPQIDDETEFQDDHVLRYLHQFYVAPSVVYHTSWKTNVNFNKTSFYLPLEGGFVNLPPVRSIRNHDTEVKRQKRQSEGASQKKGASQLSTKLGHILPDVCLTGYLIGKVAEGTYPKQPEGDRVSVHDDNPQKVLYAALENKWEHWPKASGMEPKGKINLHLDSLQFTNMEAIAQTSFYSLLAYHVSKCRSAMALVNGNFTRILNLSHLGPEGKEVVLEGVTLGGDGGRRILVEAHPDVVAKLRHHRLPCLSPEQFGELAAGVSFLGIQWKAPNSLIAKYEDWSLDPKAKERLDATVYLNLALATHHPETVPDPPIDNRSLEHVIDTDTSEAVVSSSKRQKRADVSGPTEYLPLSPAMIATPSPSPSSFSTISSCFEIERPVSVEEWCLSVKQKASADGTFIDTAIPPNPVFSTTAEQVLPRENWTHGDYLDHFSRLGVTFVLATPTEVDVLLARAAKFGWGGALGRG
ncbi:hypothetical protein L202_07192 [Cryptococcus amylolentus CBS 6039]|uniref:Uncharacterized protein n=1 Tax=Cryptococcus amylolentus CBS 6039 TaxID=1295533 RepID=A0A1E3HEX5_9TREE|nr:hypothetical protein L202_07192 [Cryptococcus amylolentus CBS 6039]ODN74890.1 hypothetical protein L202_07192 [Cryptococcus amylolentus CBS 6039]